MGAGKRFMDHLPDVEAALASSATAKAAHKRLNDRLQMSYTLFIHHVRVTPGLPVPDRFGGPRPELVRAASRRAGIGC
jgi:hypothetical protein